MADQPLLSVVARVVQNDAENPGDGGAVRLVSRLTTEQRVSGWEQVNGVLLARLDEPLRQFPTTRAEKELRTFRIVITEVDPSEWPEDAPVLPVPAIPEDAPDARPRAVLIRNAPTADSQPLVRLGETRWTDADDAADAGSDDAPDTEDPPPTP